MSDTPVIQQYKKIKSKYPNTILFFRLGDFYEMFENDAKEVSSILDIVLTKKNTIPMCGVPYHAASNYIARLLKTGKKIAICEQLSNTPPKGSKIVEREVVEIITPGTIVNEDYLDNKNNNYLAAICKYKNLVSFSYVDISTGEFFVNSFPFEENVSEETILRELLKISPSEIIIQESFIETNDEIKKIIAGYGNAIINRYPDWNFNLNNSFEILKKHFNVTTLKCFGIDDNSAEVITAGIIIEYLRDNAGILLSHITNIKKINSNNNLELDGKTIKNLEILRNMNDGSVKNSLLNIIDYTKTSMGGRLLKKWIQNPLKNCDLINSRLDLVDFFYKNQLLLTKIRTHLSSLNDIERFTSRLALNKINAKDLLGLNITLNAFLDISDTVCAAPSGSEAPSGSAAPSDGTNLFHFFADKKICEEILSITKILDAAVYEDPPITITDGNLIKKGYNSELDKLRNLRDNSQEILNQYIESEKEKSGIPNLKIRYNKIIGYYLEITKSYLDNIPPHFIRRQSLVGSERYTTEKLISLETELNSAVEKITVLEKEIFIELRDSIKKHIPFLRTVAENLSEIDCIQSNAYASTSRGYTRPKVNNGEDIVIRNGRHPVVEATLPQGEYIPNDVILNKKKFFVVLTGPNMAGKSTFLRQTALIILMAQAGMFVPAESAEIGLVDKIFCRVGSSDNLARGESTFLTEMSETSYIIRNATENSLLLMDEVGRGTSTDDGLSIARSICEYIIKKIKAKTLFATHYHELAYLELQEIENLSMNAIESEGKLVFLKKIIKGASNKSYGINVAEMAGIPYSIISRAEELLEFYEEKRDEKESKTDGDSRKSHKSENSLQNELFSEEHIVSKDILSIDINNTTPIEALKHIENWQKKLN